MSFPKTIDELVAIGMAIQMSEPDHLGKPYQPNGDGDSFVLQASASARYGPYYSLVFGCVDDNNFPFGSVFVIEVRLNDGQTVHYGFHRLSESTEWIWTSVESTGSLEMKIATTFSSHEMDLFINWAFRYFYAEVLPEQSVPRFFQEGAKDSFEFPYLKKVDLMAELEKERLQKEEEERLKAKKEANLGSRKLLDDLRRHEQQRQRELAERQEAEKAFSLSQRLALQAEARRVLSLERWSEETQRKAAEEQSLAVKALKAKQLGAKEWFLQTIKSSNINSDNLLKEQLGKLSTKDTKLFSEFLDDKQIGSELIKNWWDEYCAQPKITF